MSLPEQSHFDYVRKCRIKRPSKVADEYIAIPVHEFERLQKRIESELVPRHNNFPSAYYALFGAAFSAGITIPQLFAAKGLANWVIPAYIISASALFVLGAILVSL